MPIPGTSYKTLDMPAPGDRVGAWDEWHAWSVPACRTTRLRLKASGFAKATPDRPAGRRQPACFGREIPSAGSGPEVVEGSRTGDRRRPGSPARAYGPSPLAPKPFVELPEKMLGRALLRRKRGPKPKAGGQET